MSSLMIVGADRLGSILDKLSSFGFHDVYHVNGRKVKMVNMEIPEKVGCILVLTDFVNHNLSTEIKKRAKSQCIPIYFAKRSWCSIYKTLQGR
jgi:hypothetical protein